MKPKIKADLCGIGQKTNFMGGEVKAFSVSDSTINLEHIASIIPRIFRDGRTACRFDWKRQKPGRIKSL